MLTPDEVAGSVVEMSVGDDIVITSDDPLSWTGRSNDDTVATFVAGTSRDGAEFNPGLSALGAGRADFTLTRPDRDPLTFTVVVAPTH